MDSDQELRNFFIHLLSQDEDLWITIIENKINDPLFNILNIKILNRVKGLLHEELPPIMFRLFMEEYLVQNEYNIEGFIDIFKSKQNIKLCRYCQKLINPYNPDVK